MQSLTRPAVPADDSADGGSALLNPLDAFIFAKLKEAGLSRSPEADRRVLIRRLTFDLHGLPPSPQEIDRFVRDSDPHAYEHLVDRLLASPRYGERMARRWLDVVHYGESDGFGMDRPRMNAWPYRDYLIRSFNEDKPYSRLVQEQVAADAMYPDQPANIPALGFLSAGPFNESALVEQVNGTLCWNIALNLDRDDMVSNVASTFMSVTLHCARCHNHKFDPITQLDYYRMQSVFAGVRRGDRDYDDEIKTTHARNRWLAVRRQIQDGVALAALADTDRRELLGAKDAAAQSIIAAEKNWRTLAVSATSDSSKTTVVALPDGSIRFEGAAPANDTYMLAAKVPLDSIMALRLEALTDAALPAHGAGREPQTGGFRLSEFRVVAAPASSPEKIASVKVRTALADFSENGSDIAKAIDGQPASAWGIHPRETESHQAVFIFDKPVANKGGTLFTIRLEQLTGGKNLIGRLRLSACAEAPSPADVVSPDVLALLKTPQARRNADLERKIEAGMSGAMVEAKLAELPAPHVVFAVADDLPAFKNYRLPKDALSIHVLQRGDVTKPMPDVVQPGALQAVATPPAIFTLADANDESARRTALAHWLTDPANPLTWRSIANRIWLWNFDRGIVETANDFGKMGSPPSHPALLDWLACELRDNGGSIKRLTRLIVTSETYRQSSPQNETARKQDSDNRLLWRMNRHRLDSEQLRDALLVASGKLDATMGGPSAMQFNYDDPNKEVSPRISYDTFDPDSPASYRRGVYRFLFRNINDPLLEAFDAPNCSLATPKRDVTTTPLQTLSLFNNKFVLRQCEHLAERLARESAGIDAQINEAYLLLYGRPATSDESSLIGDYCRKHGLAQTCRVLVNANEFLFLP
ncbi:MAG TPA: DUF1549 and DUF1553 domain-containing protein [Tepidisphaeraceae bacterium]|nr:DUF1549 and DUF1553 domain-containing protein [Tepidisphaeraceae bacterium]